MVLARSWVLAMTSMTRPSSWPVNCLTGSRSPQDGVLAVDVVENLVVAAGDGREDVDDPLGYPGQDGFSIWADHHRAADTGDRDSAVAATILAPSSLTVYFSACLYSGCRRPSPYARRTARI